MRGVFYIVKVLPIWFLFASLYFICIDVITIGREKLEGLAYNIAWSGKYGDLALITVIAICATIVQRVRVSDSWFNSWRYQMICLVTGLVIGALVNRSMLPSLHAMDIYHNMIVVPILFFSLATLVPVLFAYGRIGEKQIAVVLLSVWLGLVIADHVTGRIDQRKWLERNGIYLK